MWRLIGVSRTCCVAQVLGGSLPAEGWDVAPNYMEPPAWPIKLPALPVEPPPMTLLSRLLGRQVEPDSVLIDRRYHMERDVMMLTLSLRTILRQLDAVSFDLAHGADVLSV